MVSFKLPIVAAVALAGVGNGLPTLEERQFGCAGVTCPEGSVCLTDTATMTGSCFPVGGDPSAKREVIEGRQLGFFCLGVVCPDGQTCVQSQSGSGVCQPSGVKRRQTLEERQTGLVCLGVTCPEGEGCVAGPSGNGVCKPLVLE